MPSVSFQPYEEKEGLLSIEEFLRMDFEEKVELVEGKIIRMGWTNFTHASLVAWLCRILGDWAEKEDWGWITGGDTGVLTCQDPDTARGADIACISYDRYAKIKRKGKILDIGPELIVEVVSPSNTWNDVQDKIAEYFSIGTQEVWVVSPSHYSVTVYRTNGEIEAFDPGKNEVVVTDQLPGFQLPLNKMKELILRAEGEDDSEG